MKSSAWLQFPILFCCMWLRIDAGRRRKLPQCHCTDTDIRIIDESAGSCSCWACPTCKEGLGLSVLCNSTVTLGTDIKCLPCESGKHFSSASGTEQCRRCSKCQDFEVVLEKCSPWTDTVCGDCRSGYYRDGLTSGFCRPCSKCCKNGKSNTKVEKCVRDGQPKEMQCAFGIGMECPQPTSPSMTTVVRGVAVRGTVATAPEPKQPAPSASVDSNHASEPTIRAESKERGFMELNRAERRAGLIVTIILALFLLLLGSSYLKRRLCGRTTPSVGGFVVYSSQTTQVGGRQPPSRSTPSRSSNNGECAPMVCSGQQTSGSGQNSEDLETAAGVEQQREEVCVRVNNVLYVEHPTWPITETRPTQMVTAGELAQRGRKVSEIPLDPWLKRICQMLDARRSDFNDCRMLAEKVGLDKVATMSLTDNTSIPSPTEVILLQHFGHATVGRLSQILHEINRADAAEVIDQWVASELRKSIRYREPQGQCCVKIKKKMDG